MRRISAGFLAAVAGLAMAAFGAGAAQAQQTIVFGGSDAIGGTFDVQNKLFTKLVNERAAGKLRVNFIAGEQLVTTKLATAEKEGLALYLNKGLRAVSLRVNVFNAVGGHLRPGNHVDVLGTFDFGSGEKSDVRTVTLMQDVWVMSVVDDIGRATERDVITQPPEGAPPPEKEPGPSEILGNEATITVAVRPEEAQKLVLAQQIGDLKIGRAHV